MVVDDRLFLTNATDSPVRMVALALDKNSGQELWQRQLHEGGVRTIHENNSHATSTPVADKQNVYVAFLFDNFIHVSALDQKTGQRVWTTSCGPCTADWGFAGSLALWRGLIFVLADNHESGWLTAVDASDGMIAWRRQRTPSDRGSYSSPIVANLHGQAQIVTEGGGEVVAYDPASAPRSGPIRESRLRVPRVRLLTTTYALLQAAGQDENWFASGSEHRAPTAK